MSDRNHYHEWLEKNIYSLPVAPLDVNKALTGYTCIKSEEDLDPTVLNLVHCINESHARARVYVRYEEDVLFNGKWGSGLIFYREGDLENKIAVMPLSGNGYSARFKKILATI